MIRERRQGRVVRAGAQEGADRRSSRTPASSRMPSIGARAARREGRRLGRRRGDRAGRRGRRPHRRGADHACCCRRWSTRSTSRSSPPAASSTDAGWSPRSRTARPAIGMGTRFLLTSDSTVGRRRSRSVYLRAGVNGTVVTTARRRRAAPGAAHRAGRPAREGRPAHPAARASLRNAVAFQKESGTSWPVVLREGAAMKDAATSSPGARS